jgi:hypothetical protein
MAKQSVSSEPQLHDEAAAFAWSEGVIWPEGPICGGVVDVDETSHCEAQGR